MKKIFIFLAFSSFAMVARAGGRGFATYGEIGPAISSMSTTVTIAAPATGRTNCLTYLVTLSTSAYTLRILDGGTTAFQLTFPANTGLVKDWSDQDPWCASINNSLSFTTSVIPAEINYKGFIR